MAYSDVEWANGQTITEAKLDTMQGNTDHVREEVNYTEIHIAFWESLDETVSNSVYLDLEIDTTTVGAQQAGAGDKHQADLDISGFSEGVHSLVVTLTPTGHVFTLRFVKTSDLEFLSYWATIGHRTQGLNYWKQLEDFTVILHREAQGW